MGFLKAFTHSSFHATCAFAHGVSCMYLLTIIEDGRIVDLTLGSELTYEPSMFSFLAAFTAITCLAHINYIFGKPSSEVRFLEYFVTASIMFFVIGVLVGFTDLYVLLALAGLTATTMTFGYLEDRLANQVGNLMFKPHVLGYVPYSIAWFLVTVRFFDNVNVPNFVTVIYIVELVLFSSFGLVQLFLGATEEADGAYNILSLLSKMLLVWLCVGGILAM